MWACVLDEYRDTHTHTHTYTHTHSHTNIHKHVHIHTVHRYCVHLLLYRWDCHKAHFYLAKERMAAFAAN